ncbi:HDOD domain-containing protein [Candidatus Reidiella endopervernicosa]|uniref:HDOD domain-containing protein n=1 Tax=Candidatus Reidiella endopervernicosa TaxID=2738883 RepID=A0A6N0HRX6_9GAMM|nr:HDOD domain-containing protein [Solemya pervernicosa gill symbiont]QKQ25000.1 HDOD domain-containing protein [Candidatus Reidiella endopervernicosa]
MASDVGLSAAILKTINSPYYGLSRMISDIQQAVMLLGTRSVANLVATHEIRHAMNQKSCISHERFWDEATDVAKTMVYIGKKTDQKVQFEELYAVGLFHDCGIPAMANRFDDYKSLLIEANEKHDATISELEEERYNTNHAVVGYFIANSWDLPRGLCELILRHHEEDALDQSSDEAFVTMYSILKMAENIVERTRRFHSNSEWLWVKDGVLEALGLTSLDYSDLEDDVSEFVLV